MTKRYELGAGCCFSKVSSSPLCTVMCLFRSFELEQDRNSPPSTSSSSTIIPLVHVAVYMLEARRHNVMMIDAEIRSRKSISKHRNTPKQPDAK